MMGILVKVIIKERIELKLGECFSKPFGFCLEKIGTHKLMSPEHIFFLQKFKKSLKVRFLHKKWENS